MTSTDSAKRPPEAELAALVHGLQHRGLAVGVDDAARIKRLFRYAGDWSHHRRVRALKTLLARSDEERRLLDQLAPFLFVDAKRRSEGRAAKVPAIAGARQGLDSAEISSCGKVDARRENEQDSTRERRRTGWAVTAVLLVGVALGAKWLKPQPGSPSVIPTPSPEQAPPPTEFPPPPPAPSPPQALPPPSEAPRATEEIEVGTPPPPPRWPFVLVLAATSVPVWWVGSRWWRARFQERNIREIATSEGGRSYRLELPAARLGNHQNPQAVREAAFHLSAPTADAPAAWLDVERTVEATVRNAGRLALRWATWREHRPTLFIEDVSPSMANRPGFGQQLADSMSRQGGDVERYFMNGTPEVLSPDPDLRRRIPLGQVLAGLIEPAVVVVSHATALDRRRNRAQVHWLGLVANATWLHPGSVETWGPGARWLAKRLRVVPMTDEGLLRLGSQRRRGGALALRRWRPSRTLSRAADSRAAGLRATLGDAAFWWLASGAVLDRIGALSADLWWALHSEGIAPAPREQIDRVWALDEVRVGAGGTVRLDADLREALLAVLVEEEPHLLSRVVAWAEAINVADLKHLEEGSLAEVEARATLARLLLVDPKRRREARRQLKQLGDAGFGEWAELGKSEAEIESRGGLRLVRTRRPPRIALAGAVIGTMAMGLAAASLSLPAWRELVFPPEPDFRVLEPISITPDRPLRFYDFHQLADDVWVQVDQKQLRTQKEPGQPTVWSLDWNSVTSANIAPPGTVELRLGYDLPLTEEPWIVDLYDVVDVTLIAPGETDSLGRVSLSWSIEGPDDSMPAGWDVLRDGISLGRVNMGVIYTGLPVSFEDQPKSGVAWNYQVEATGRGGRPYRSNIVEVRLSPQSPLPTSTGAAGNAGKLKFAMPSYQVNEHEDSAQVAVRRVLGSVGAVSVRCNTADGTADARADYITTSADLNWTDGDTEDKVCTIPITNDNNEEGDETINLSLRTFVGGAGPGSQTTATLTIVNDDEAGELSFTTAAYSVEEDVGIAHATVGRTGGSNGAVSVLCGTANGSAQIGQDYSAKPHILNWTDGDTAEKNCTIPITDDAEEEGDETINLSLTDFINGAEPGSRPTATLTILANDLIPAKVVGADLRPGATSNVTSAVTFCVVFEATTKMAEYAKVFTDTIDEVLAELNIDTGLAAAGFVLMQDVAKNPFEITHLMPLDKATDWLRHRALTMSDDGDQEEPILDAMVLAQNRFPWNDGAERIAIVVASNDAKSMTVASVDELTAGLTATDIARQLFEADISVLALQAGSQHHRILIKILSTLATETGGEFYRAPIGSIDGLKRFSTDLTRILNRNIDEEDPTANTDS